MKRSITLLLFLITQTLVAQETILTPEDVASIEYITDAVISENGEKIAYQKLVPKDPLEENAPASVHLYVYDRSTKQTIPYVTGYNTNNISFRPGHNSITFTAQREKDKTAALYEIAMAGGEAQKIFEFDGPVISYDWHADGNKLAFVSHEPEEEKSPLPYQPEVYEDNLQNSTAYIVELNAPNPRALNMEGHTTAVKWSPDGGKLAVSAAPSSLVDDFYTGQKIYIVDANGLSVTGQVEHKAKLGEFEWSPNGKRIAFIAGADENDPIDGRIFIADASGGTPQILQPDFKGKFEGLEWKDDKTLTYLASEGVYSSLGTLGLDGKMTRFYQNESVAISHFSRSSKDVISFVASTAQHPNELYMLNSRGPSAHRVTFSNPWLQNEKFGKQEVINYKTADGFDIQGILIHPVSEAAGQSPLITVVHGGPEAHYNNGWLTGYSLPGQMAAGQGYYVFYPNYRGSTGRGVEFAKSSQGDPGGKEFDDIIDGIDYLIANYNIDRNKVGVTGGSYGGYATAWMATRHSDRFAAGVMSVGISNNISKWGTSDIPEEMFLVHSRKRIWDDYQFFLERSPIFYADQAKTPLLILHGKEDTRVDPGQSYELYRHIKTRTDTPVRLVLYPGEGHGNRKSTARYDYSLRMMRWFNSFLKENSSGIPDDEITLDE